VKLAPDDGFYHYKLGEVYFRQHDWSSAADEYGTAVQCSPCNEFYHLRLASAYIRQQLYDEALAMFERTVEIDPDNPAYHHLLGEHLELMGKSEQAQAHYHEAGRLGAYDRDYIRRVHQRCGRLFMETDSVVGA